MTDMDALINESFKELAPRGGGDWADVVARSDALGSAQHRRRLLTIAIAIAAFLVCSGTTLAIGGQFFGWFSVPTPQGWFSVETSRNKAPATRGEIAYVAGETLYRPHKQPQRLAFPLHSTLEPSSDATLAVSSPGGRYVIYQAWRRNSPMLFVHDTIASRELLLARGAQTVAWSDDGRIAYFRADYERYDQKNGSYVGNVVVQTLNGKPTVWTRRSGNYEVLGWARGELLVEILRCEFFTNCLPHPTPGVYALNRSGQLRYLHLAKLATLSPDGRYAFGVADYLQNDYEVPTSRVRVSRVDTGKVVATLDLERPLKRSGFQGLGSLIGASWRGDEIVGSAANTLIFFKLHGRQLAIQAIIRAPSKMLPKKWHYSIGVPIFTGPTDDRFVVTASGEIDFVTASLEDRSRCREAVLVCSRAQHSCMRVTYLPTTRGVFGTFAVVANLSRP